MRYHEFKSHAHRSGLRRIFVILTSNQLLFCFRPRLPYIKT
nr:MAG TPA_asm: hypothetical protein [Caudoviricetes sp.]